MHTYIHRDTNLLTQKSHKNHKIRNCNISKRPVRLKKKCLHNALHDQISPKIPFGFVFCCYVLLCIGSPLNVVFIPSENLLHKVIFPLLAVVNWR